MVPVLELPNISKFRSTSASFFIYVRGQTDLYSVELVIVEPKLNCFRWRIRAAKHGYNPEPIRLFLRKGFLDYQIHISNISAERNMIVIQALKACE